MAKAAKKAATKKVVSNKQLLPELPRSGTAQIMVAKNKQYYVVYKAANGEVLAATEMFKAKQGAHKNIEAMEHLFMYAPIIVDVDGQVIGKL